MKSLVLILVLSFPILCQASAAATCMDPLQLLASANTPSASDAESTFKELVSILNIPDAKALRVHVAQKKLPSESGTMSLIQVVAALQNIWPKLQKQNALRDALLKALDSKIEKSIRIKTRREATRTKRSNTQMRFKSLESIGSNAASIITRPNHPFELIVGINLGDIIIWNIKTGKISKRLEGKTQSGNHRLRTNADGSRLVGTHASSLSVWDLNSGTISGENSWPSSFTVQDTYFTPDGNLKVLLLLTHNQGPGQREDYSFRIVDFESSKFEKEVLINWTRRRKGQPWNDRVLRAKYDADSSTLYWVQLQDRHRQGKHHGVGRRLSLKTSLGIWKTDTGESYYIDGPRSDSSNLISDAIFIVPNQKGIVVRQKGISFYNLRKQKVNFKQTRNRTIELAAVSPSGEYLATASAGHIIIWDTTKETRQVQFDVKEDERFQEIAFTQDNKYLIVNTYSDVFVYDWQAKKLVHWIKSLTYYAGSTNLVDGTDLLLDVDSNDQKRPRLYDIAKDISELLEGELE